MTQAQADALADMLEKRFSAEVETEKVTEEGRYRFAVISPMFRQMPHLDRQDAIWAAVDQALPLATSADVTLILAYAPDELERAA